jgi:hypothetical protein
MGYADVANLSKDSDFTERLAAGLTGESVLKTGDALADLILKNPPIGASMFMPLVSSAPGFGDKYASGGQESITDGEILSAMQAAWPRVTDLYDSTLNPV